MALKKSSIYDINAVGNNLQERTNSNIVNAIFGNNRTEVNSRMAFEEINVDDITPRSINQYSQTRISRLAKSIRSTNDRLIHPIILVRPQDLPENHEVLQKFKEQGKNIEEIKYILVDSCVIADSERFSVHDIINFRSKQETVRVIRIPHEAVAYYRLRRVGIEILICCLVIILQQHHRVLPLRYAHACCKIILVVPAVLGLRPQDMH